MATRNSWSYKTDHILVILSIVVIRAKSVAGARSLLFGTSTLLIMAMSNFVLFAIVVYLLFAIRTARKHKRAAIGLSDKRLNAIFRSFCAISKRRTGLSESLIALSFGEETPHDATEEIAHFLELLCDDVKRAVDVYAKSSSAVTVKVIVPLSDDTAGVRTIARDSMSRSERGDIYNSLEPYSVRDHSLISELVLSDPPKLFVYRNDLSSSEEQYRNPYESALELFSSSAAHLISDPNSKGFESVYGFLMIDGKEIDFSRQPIRALMEMACSILYFGVQASAAVRYMHSREHTEKAGLNENDG